MNCTGGNISIGYERYSLLDSQLYASMTPLTATPTQEDDLNLYVKNTTFNGSANMYWKMGVPLLISGNCTGYVRFSLVAS
jgi:hypothetical protein